ncbi:hypothetical protein J2125_002804 [Erwinia toletana]|uniref:Uncharacterized protein n=1 Tax=Winslowiella toletana TaxID=92490 RepID=A0ABS4PBR0_9GAMM|nr:hypothetical protein [Winslowiella toletana]MBP2169612.1 hypothetical protein [Winslowiella toletana]
MPNKHYHDPMVLNPHRLFTAVGTCGTNQPEEVKKLQRMIMNAGYQQATVSVEKYLLLCDVLALKNIRR